ncbi:hypothetical protein ACWF95_41635 [Streptomyces vinaceus]
MERARMATGAASVATESSSGEVAPGKCGAGLRSARRWRSRSASVTAAATAILAIVAAAPVHAADSVTARLVTQAQIQEEMERVAPLQAQSIVNGYPAIESMSNASAVGERISRDDVLAGVKKLELVPPNGTYRWATSGWETSILLGYGLYDHKPVYEAASSYCGRNPGLCGFVGGLDTSDHYPVTAMGENVHGQGGSTTTVTTSSRVTKSTTSSSGWSVKIGIGSSPTGGFELNSSTSTTYGTITGTDQSYSFNIPDGKTGRIEAHSNGAYYLGYIVVNVPLEGLQSGGTTLIPARVLVNSDKAPNAVTFFAADATPSGQ